LNHSSNTLILEKLIICTRLDTNQRSVLAEQYRTSSNLEARIALHTQFSTSSLDYHQWLFDYIEVPNNAVVLELGTGSGKLWQINRKRIPAGWNITLTDFSAGMLEDAKKNLLATGAFDLKIMDAQDILFKDKTFDLVIANHMLYHVPDIDKAIREIRRVLKPAGRFYAGTGGLNHMKEMDDFIEEHMASKLGRVFERMDTVTGRFALENGARQISKHFETVKIYYPPTAHLQVTEGEPFMAYILSMARWEKLTKDIPNDLVDNVVAETRIIANEKIPIRITTSSRLFEAY
jgi:ubiquinone/menaquinone biosynthesis C-methylase UbiE